MQGSWDCEGRRRQHRARLGVIILEDDLKKQQELLDRKQLAEAVAQFTGTNEGSTAS